MRPVRGSKTSTNAASDASKTSRSKGSPNDASKRTTRSNSNPNRSNNSKKPEKEKNKEVIDIQPQVYSFRVPSSPSPGSVMNALLPPYWLYHDHAFGVIWMLFHPDKKYIGIAQLHWCLRFLLDLKNTEGEYTGDVNVCIQAVQDDLIEQYANLGTVLESQETSKEKNADPGTKNNANDAKSNANKKGDVTKTDVDKKKSAETSKEDGERNESASSPVLQSQQSNLSELSTCSSMDESGYISAQSLTYNEMISRGPAPYTEQIPLEQIYKAGANITDLLNSTPDIAAMLTSDTSPPDIPLAEMGTEEFVNFLNVSRVEHVERIQKEIGRLHDLEKFMEGVDKQGFKAYVSKDLARRLDKVDGQSLIREVDMMLK